ncbi:aspartate/glutamate racemase family protein [Streptomyces sp. NBC_01754]|uniref:aspartate/glutamate racemase family protein n=1 Tax=Streptomyces sp. NBC_01754 TaxID=2975930 RepID=UPI002DD9B831|nr:aspartate/glutamate racemase family protein [Streptomyces sp. NBC_01754]WSC90937.1 aspartate/glutamate racemase family protein [Streptomyces sp. NBC_01754]WSC96569.1 aspartate/glutamate racemase family protein [Streptomyces sp. NBC_01754]
MEIAVVAGTPFDTEVGANLLRNAGHAAVPYPMAGSPDEQDALQYERPGTLRAAFLDLVRDLDARGHRVVMLFCNSLSAVVDLDAASAEASLTLVSPAAVYREVAAAHRRALVLTGNGSAVAGYERVTGLLGHRALSVSDPALVRAVEAGDAAAAFHGSSLPETLRLAGRARLDAVVLACTHFTAVLPQVLAACRLPVVDVGSRLVELAVEAADAAAPGRRAA